MQIAFQELKTQIIAFSKICDVSPRHESLPYVIIVENCFMLNSITDVFMPLINELEASKHKNCPFIIGKTCHCSVLSLFLFYFIIYDALHVAKVVYNSRHRTTSDANYMDGLHVFLLRQALST